MAVIPGMTRFRKRMWGKQSAFGTAVTPTRVIPWRGVPVIDPHVEDDDSADTGSIDPNLPPTRTATDITVALSGTLNYQDAPAMFAAGLLGGVSPTGAGAAKTWDFQALSLTPTEFDYFTEQFTDDETDDAIEIRDVILENFELSYGEDLGPWALSAAGRASSFEYPISGGPENLTLGSNFTKVYGADTQLFINDAAGSIGTTQVSDTVHGMTLRVEHTVDLKRFSNGSNTRFQISGYGVSARVITAEFVLAKSAAALAEAVKWLSADPVNRYLEARATSPAVIPGTTSTHHSLSIKLSGTWRTRADGEIGGNATITLMLSGRYDATLGYPIKATVVTDRSALP